MTTAIAPQCSSLVILIFRSSRLPKGTDLMLRASARGEQLVAGQIAELGLSSVVTGKANHPHGPDFPELRRGPVAPRAAEAFFFVLGHNSTHRGVRFPSPLAATASGIWCMMR